MRAQGENAPNIDGLYLFRACASFFKRAIVAGAQYLCRQGTFNCSSTRSKHTSPHDSNDYLIVLSEQVHVSILPLDHVLPQWAWCTRGRFKSRRPRSLREFPRNSSKTRHGLVMAWKWTVLFRAMITRRRVREIEMIMTCENRIMVPVKEVNSLVFRLHDIFLSSSQCTSLLQVPVLGCSTSLFRNRRCSLKMRSQHCITDQERASTMQIVTKIRRNSFQEIILKEYMVKFALVLSYYMTTKLFGDAQTKWVRFIKNK